MSDAPRKTTDKHKGNMKNALKQYRLLQFKFGPIEIIKKNYEIYNRSLNDYEHADCGSHGINISWCWFSTDKGYGSAASYGKYINTWKVKQSLRLLNISDNNRKKFNSLFKKNSCDDQYSGGEPNIEFHNNLHELLRILGLDGTYANEYPTESTCGVSEVVLYNGVVTSKLEHIHSEKEVINVENVIELD